ncbi:hypothetical protein HGRIS_010188 [Hohenbuehelia grisea]|uniref:DUF7223 domain-containing protein n=1 Tax=Hohenbuehelia grisea TaxID=104357 RepID=A0ABR3J3V1_9AGAR
MKAILGIFVFAAWLASAKPHNDWNQACFDGECAYDLAGTEESGHGVLKITGPPGSITDITSAAGWVVLNCDPQSMAQEIRLVCKGDNADAAGCNHLFAHNGPVHKVVRLPESCGSGPFARISAVQLDVDQSIPSHMGHHVSRRDGSTPEVHVLSIDTNWAAVEASEGAEVSFMFLGGNAPEFAELTQEDLWNPFKAIGNKIKQVGEKIGKGVKAGFDKVKEGISKIQNWSFDKKITPKPIDFQKHLDLLNIHQKCGAVDAVLQLSVDTKAHAEIIFGATAAGTLIPPKIRKFGVMTEINADLEAKLTAHAQLNGDLDSGKKRIFQIGVPGLSIPGIFTVGPMLELSGQVKGHLDLNLDVEAGLNFRVDGVQIWLPKSAGTASQRKVAPKDTPLKLSASAALKASGTIEGHVIAAIKLGVDALGGKIKAAAFAQVDAAAIMDINAEGNADGSVTKGVRPASVSNAIAKREYTPPYGLAARDLANRSLDRRAAGFSGCFGLRARISIDGGVEGSFLGLLSGDKTFNIFLKEFKILKKCWALGTAKRSISEWRMPLERRSAQISICPKSVDPPVAVDSEVVKAADITT